MKKFLIVVILLIPIVVTLALNATGRFISMVTPDNPTGIEIRDSFNRVIGREDIIRVDINEENEFIMVDILPLMTKENGINSPEKDDDSIGDVTLERLSGTNKYYIKPLKVGIVKVVLSALANVNVRRAITFNVTSDSIEYVNIYNNFGNDIESAGVYYPTESQQLYFDIFPIEALSHNLVSWKVTNGTAVEISANGYMSIVEKGLAVVRVMAKDKNQNLITKEIVIDTSRAVSKSLIAYVDNSHVEETYINNKYALDPENSVTTKVAPDKFEIIRTDPETEEVTRATVTIVEVDDNEWDFLDRPATLYTSNGPHFLKIINLLTNEIAENATFEISDKSIAQFDEGTGALVPIKPGSFEVTARYKGSKKTMLIRVKERVSSFELDLGIEDAKLGIQLTRRWGNFWFDEDGELTNQYRFGLYNKNPNFDVVWSSSDPSVISFELIEGTQDLMLTFHEEGAGKSAVIAADLVVNNRKVPGIKKAFEFKLMDTPDYINVENFVEMQKIAFDEEYNICMQSDIFANEMLQMCVGVSFYGNGFLYDASGIPELPFSTGAISIFRQRWQWGNKKITPVAGKYYWDALYDEKNIVFEEMRMQNAQDIKSAENTQSCIVAESFWRGKIAFKYMQVRNSDRGLETVWCRDVTIEGCILGDNVTYSSMLIYPEFPHYVFEYERATLLLKNNVLKHSQGPAITFSFGNSVTKEAMEAGFMPEVLIEGFLDIYNWHAQASFENMFTRIVVQSLLGYTDMPLEAVKTIEKLVAPAFKEYFVSPKLDHVYYVKDDTKYISVGLMALGSLFNPEISMITSNDPRLAAMEIPMEDENGVPLSKTFPAIKTLVQIFFPQIEKITNANIVVCYDFKNREPAIKPGDPIPQNYELYARLTGQSENLHN